MKKIERKSMKKYITEYVEYVDNNITKIDIEKHLTKINFFEWERIIHLIVTITSVILDILSMIIGICFNNILIIIIGYMIMCFVIPYIYHYFLLENCVQKMYRQYDEMTQNNPIKTRK
ncbi:MAG: hypothetical protein J6D28_02330 [Bacilli bacterium]|nr:hypothetical protein [Bacilli bacterium]